MGEPKVEVTCPLSFLLISILGHIMFLIRPSTTVFINHLCLYIATPVYLATQLICSPVVLDQQYPQITDYTPGVSSSVYTAGQHGGSLQ